jgi:hypothetical protein
MVFIEPGFGWFPRGIPKRQGFGRVSADPGMRPDGKAMEAIGQYL